MYHNACYREWSYRADDRAAHMQHQILKLPLHLHAYIYVYILVSPALSDYI
jgi:hypothetical protein